jgi:hypothetical protein
MGDDDARKVGSPWIEAPAHDRIHSSRVIRVWEVSEFYFRGVDEPPFVHHGSACEQGRPHNDETDRTSQCWTVPREPE